jgi:hypothetical protein
MITGFVFMMMLGIEYVNVQTKGIWLKKISGNRWKQYIFSAIMGAIPGCLGAFTVVVLFSHRMISFGAIVSAMIATSGDEAFVMFAIFPLQASILTIIILVVGILAGFITDYLYVPSKMINKFAEKDFPIHDEAQCKCFDKNLLLPQLSHPSKYRSILILFTSTFLILLLTGILAAQVKFWVQATVFIGILFSLFIVITVPDHFLKKHLWEHVVKMHMPRIFIWTFGTMLFFNIGMSFMNLDGWISENLWLMLILAVFIGIIPESGPHLMFVTLFAEGSIPFSILLANSISQDGHGMLPLLAESKQGFLRVKLVNIIVALIIGTSGLLLGL